MASIELKNVVKRYGTGKTANQVIHGFDPHIASIGFVWGPIPTVLEIPLIWLIPLKQMVTDGIAGSVVSAAFAILAVASLRGILHDRRLPKTTTLVIVLDGVVYSAPLI